MELFCENSSRLKTLNYFHEESYIIDNRLDSKYTFKTNILICNEFYAENEPVFGKSSISRYKFPNDILTLSFPMFPFDLAENTRKPMAFRKTENQWLSEKHQETNGFLMFSGGSKGNIGKKRVKLRGAHRVKSFSGFPDLDWKPGTLFFHHELDYWTQHFIIIQ